MWLNDNQQQVLLQLASRFQAGRNRSDTLSANLQAYYRTCIK
jgi:hypothetical protein